MVASLEAAAAKWVGDQQAAAVLAKAANGCLAGEGGVGGARRGALAAAHAALYFCT